MPLCGACHGRVHDVAGWRTDTLVVLRRGGVRILTVAEQEVRHLRHRQVLRAFREKPTGIKRPPVLAKQRRVHETHYEEWVPWLEHTVASEDHLEELIRNRAA